MNDGKVIVSEKVGKDLIRRIRLDDKLKTETFEISSFWLSQLGINPIKTEHGRVVGLSVHGHKLENIKRENSILKKGIEKLRKDFDSIIKGVENATV